MSAHDRELLRQTIDDQQHDLLAAVPAGGLMAILAVLRRQDGLQRALDLAPVPDLITGRRLDHLGANKALQICLASSGGGMVPVPDWRIDEVRSWAQGFLRACDQLAEAELVLTHCETGFMRMVANGQGEFHAWIATKRVPASWRERADIDWWASCLAKRAAPELLALVALRPDPRASGSAVQAHYLRLAEVRIQAMAYQLGYPPDATIDGSSIQTYRNVLTRLIAMALQADDREEAAVAQPEHVLVETLAQELTLPPEDVAHAVTAFTLNLENVRYHAAVPGVAAAPLVRVGSDQVVLSLFGLTTEPLFFLTRELRRRATEEYHNTAYLREDVFRQDLYALFRDKRFVTSAGRVVLRRESGNVRTDVDAVVFDRKTGTLGFFELKSQDPFARSPAEFGRQRDNILAANRQIAGILAWLNQHGADALLSRVDARAAKRFRAHRVVPFVLGRYLAHFPDGPPPDRRATWGTWPQLLRLLDGQPVRSTDTNPLLSLSTRLSKDVPTMPALADDHLPPHEITLGATRIVVYPSYAAFQANSVGAR